MGAYLNLGNVLKEEGEVEEAIASYRKAIELKPDFADAHKNLATCLHEEGDFHDALSFYSSSLEADDQISESRFHLCAAGVEESVSCYLVCQTQLTQFLNRSGDLLHGDLFLHRGLSSFLHHRGIGVEIPVGLIQRFFS